MPRIIAMFTAALCLLSLGATATAAEENKKPEIIQPVVLQVLDAEDMPVEGAVVTIKPLNGGPMASGPYTTDIDGEMRIKWVPEIHQGRASAHSEDEIIDTITKFAYVVSAPGYLPANGVMADRRRSRQVKAEHLTALSRRARVAPLSEVVQLVSESKMLGQGLDNLPKGSLMRLRLLEFYKRYDQAVRLLGCVFDMPAFELVDGSFNVRLKWQAMPWATLEYAPIGARMLIAAGLPMAVALGDSLKAPGGASAMAVIISDQTPPKGDPYAIPGKLLMVLSAPPEAFAALAKGELDSTAFLNAYPAKGSAF